MRPNLIRVRLYLIGGAVLVFLGGLLVAIGHWNRAETDRAFVEAAARAMRAPPAPTGVRFWTPDDNSQPSGVSRIRVDMLERQRRTARPPTPSPVSPSLQKPPAAPR